TPWHWAPWAVIACAFDGKSAATALSFGELLRRALGDVHTSGVADTSLLSGIGSVDEYAAIVELHRLIFLGRKRSPVRQTGMTGVPGARKLNPRVTHDRSQGARILTAAGHVLAAIRVRKNEGNFRTMKCSRTAV